MPVSSGRLRAEATDAAWADWRWHMRHRIRDLAGLERWFVLTDEEREAVRRHAGALPLGITPYYADLMDPEDPADPLRKTMIPRLAEYTVRPWERRDPLGEEDHEVVPGLIHTYPGKALFLVTDTCATYCRYCTRGRLVGAGEHPPHPRRWEEALAYIRAHPEIRDVLLSGGDPFLLSDRRLGWLLERLAAMPHLDLIRIGTKIPAVLPQRVTGELAAVLAAAHPVWLSLHFTHPRELTPETAAACDRLSRAGIPLMAQTVLLAGVNDDPDTLHALLTGLLRIRVKPYYLHQCDPIQGSSHFKTPVAKGLDLIRGLHGRITGYGVPLFMIDAPGGGGKVPLSPDFVVGRDGDSLLLQNYQGRVYAYPDPAEGPATIPL